MNAEQVVSIFKALMTAPISRLDLAKQANANPKSVGKILTELKANKMVYVIAYSNQIDGRNRVKLYALGDGEDAKPKTSQSQEDRSRRSYAKKKMLRKAFTPLTQFVGGKSLWQ